MLNQVVLVGNIIGEPTKCYDINNKEFTNVRISVNRQYKNEFGEYERDIFNIKLSGIIAENTIEYCKNGDVIGVKGKLESNGDRIEIIAEKITFLKSDRG